MSASLAVPAAPALRRPAMPAPRALPHVRDRALRHIPGRRGLPLLGILPEAVVDPMAFTRRMLEEHGPVHRFHACGSWNVLLVGPEANELVLHDREGLFSSKGGWAPVFGRHFDGGLLLRDGQDHLWHRKVIAGAFKGEQLQSYVTIFARNVAALARAWDGSPINGYEFAQQLTFMNGYEAFLGRDAAQATRDDLLAFRHLMRSSTSVIPVALPGNSEWRAKRAKAHIERLIRPMLATPPAPERTDLLAVLQRLKAAGELTDDEIVGHLVFVIAASFDALSSGTLSTLYYLAVDPAWQTRLRAELTERIPDVRAMRIDQVQTCAAAERTVKEALRLNAAAPVLWRRATRAFEFQGVHIPAGTITGVNPMMAHLMPSIWPEPDRFDPDRFLPENSVGRHRHAFVPFGGGAHGCLGANFAYIQIRTALRVLLAEREIAYEGDAPPRWYHWPNCRPRGPLMLSARRVAG